MVAGRHCAARCRPATAATAYEQLSRLSDAELQRRGRSGENLARDVLAAWAVRERSY